MTTKWKRVFRTCSNPELTEPVSFLFFFFFFFFLSKGLIKGLIKLCKLSTHLFSRYCFSVDEIPEVIYKYKLQFSAVCFPVICEC